MMTSLRGADEMKGAEADEHAFNMGMAHKGRQQAR